MLFDSLTNERLKKYFKNNFDLCNFAIQVGRNRVLGGGGASSLSEVLDAVEEKAEEREEEELGG